MRCKLVGFCFRGGGDERSGRGLGIGRLVVWFPCSFVGLGKWEDGRGEERVVSGFPWN